MAGGRVVIVGVGCRLRDASSGPELLRALAEARPFSSLPIDRWDPSAFGPPPSARLLERFDLDFRAFRLPPAQIERMHRMERAALAALRDALVDAGREIAGPWGERTTVHMAASSLGLDPAVDHLARVRLHEAESALAAVGAKLPREALAAGLAALEATAPPISVDSLMTTAGMTAGRLANAFDLGGGHLAYDAGGASSLAALAGAVTALEEGECDLAVVGAVSPLVTATLVEAYRKRRLYSEGDRLGDSPLGTLVGEGALALVLEREDDARARARRSYAVLCGLGQAATGRRGPITGAAAMVERAARVALDQSRFSPAQIDCVEWQGAGLGALDEGERAALLTVYGEREAREVPLVRTTPSLGYLGAAAGLASVAAACLALERGERRDENGAHPVRRVAVSSLGLGGSAHHAVLAHAGEERSRASVPRAADRHVAIVGLGAVMPGAPDVPALWRLILEGGDAIAEIPPERWDAASFMSAAARGQASAVACSLAGQLPRVEPDAALLRLPPASLPYVDGSVVLAAQASAQAIADAALSPEQIDPQRTGVVVGHLPLRSAEYLAERGALVARTAATIGRALESEGIDPPTRERVLEAFRHRMLDGIPPLREETLDSMSSLAGAARVAARFDFRGSVLAIDAACASSLAALHHGVRALQRGELDTVIVAASAYNLIPEYYVALATLGALARTGSRPFDGGDGMVPAEGAGALVLRRLSDATRDRQRVYAVVRGVALSSDGRGTALLAPSSRGQRRALERAYAAAEVAPAEVDLLEAHGTGTQIGDAVELETYGAVFAARASSDPIRVGSVKSNLGHLSSAAGMAGVLKIALALHHRTLPPMRHSGRAPTEPAFTAGTLVVGTSPQPWREPARGNRIAGVSAFGLGGVNAHVVLEEHLVHERRRAPRGMPRVEPGVAARLVVDLAPLAAPVGLPPLPAGPVLVLGAESSAVRAAVVRALEAGGVRVSCVATPTESIGAAEARLRRVLEDEPKAMVLDLRALEGEADATVAVRRAAALGRAAYPRWEEHGGRVVIATGMGGGLGFLPGERVGEGGALIGFWKALRLELPRLAVRIVDLDPSDDPSFLASTLLFELAAGGDRLEVGYLTRRRVVPVLRNAPLPTLAPPLSALEPGAVVLFSGGGRGIIFECARALSRRGLITIVTGRREPPRGDEPWLLGEAEGVAESESDAAWEAAREAALREARRADPTLTPVRFAAEWEARSQARQLHRNLRGAQAEGLPLHYRRLDVTDASACRRLVDAIIAEHGRLDGIVHGAMVERSRALPQKTEASIDATVRTKVEGLQNLLAAVAARPPRFIVAFGSIAGRLGNRGQTDYAGANDAMARLLARHAQEHRDTHCVTLEWTAWAQVGAAAHGRTVELLRQAGVEPIGPDEGVRRFCDELTHGPHGQPIALICPERQAYEWPGVERARDATGRAPAIVDDRGQPLQPAEWPLIDAVLPAGADGRAVVERLFDLRRDRYLEEHRLDDVALVPGAFIAELIAEAAAAAAGSDRVQELRDFSIEAPLRVTERTAQLASVSLRAGAAAHGRRPFEAELTVARGPATPAALTRTHARATVIVGAADAEDAPHPLPIGAPTPASVESLFGRMQAPLRLGAAFQQIERVERTERGSRAMLRAPDLRSLFAATAAPRLLLAPQLLDAAFQVAAHADALRAGGAVAIPVAFARLRLGAAVRADRPILAEAVLTADAGDELVLDVQVEQGGAVLFRVEGLRLRRILEIADARFSTKDA